MKLFRCTVLLAVFFEMIGCAGQESGQKIAIVPVAPPPPYTSTDLDELLQFAAKFAESSTTTRLKECRQLRQLYQADPGLGVRLHLLFAQSAVSACGEIGESAAMIEASLAEVGDERLKSFLIYHKAVLARLGREMERRKVLEKRIVQTRANEKKAIRRLKSQEHELEALQKKLEALKAIEQGLDEPNDGH